MLALLTSLAPVFIQIGLWAIKTFIGNQAQKDLAQKQFLDAVKNNADCVLKSLAAKTAFDAAQAELDAMEKKP